MATSSMLPMNISKHSHVNLAYLQGLRVHSQKKAYITRRFDEL